ncbi:hypothetical protein TIFTF001_026512 [Ficus carica]|uniref:Uncharacterized protein n=1 Tax=Ficus carica TaxID=3494 RepID=A0AA88DLB1_FICCA|nr:hypothetical protein TIFTF001_026512 [Ficus carica]
MVISLVQLPFEEVNGVRVPTMFKDKVSLFYALVLSLNFSFFSSVSIFGLRQTYQRTARCCLAVALGSSAAGIVIFTLLVLPAILNLLEEEDGTGDGGKKEVEGIDNKTMRPGTRNMSPRSHALDVKRGHSCRRPTTIVLSANDGVGEGGYGGGILV